MSLVQITIDCDNRNSKSEIEDIRNMNSKDKITAQEMYMKLKEFSLSKEINDDDIPQ
ncbi:37124_t:CDS:2, partial [Racocetra persica]